MNIFIRCAKFNLVGMLGMAVQLGALALFNQLAPVHYLLNSAAALEITLIHNFVWHLHYTWRDRCRHASMPKQFARFHISNGLVSLTGNLVFMRVLAGELHLPVVIANGIAIVCCSIVNFCLGQNWVFPQPA